MTSDRIFLVGLSGSGKSTVAQLVAQELGWRALDSDREIEQAAGCTVQELFQQEGEPAFRDREAAVLEGCLERPHLVVATGGGAVTTARGRDVLQGGFSVWLVISPNIAAERLQPSLADERRPLLNGNPEARLDALLQDRRQYYQLADAAIDVNGLTPGQVAEEVIRLWREHRAFGANATTASSAYRPEGHIAATVRTATATYPIIVAHGALEEAGRHCADVGLKGRAFVLADAAVRELYAPRLVESLELAGFDAEVFTVPGGEAEKNLGTVNRVYDWLIEQRAERGDFVVCLGGGVITDLGGFAAATYLRGISFVHVPTTLLGMVDASVGGKTGVDHPRGKNLIGAFAQPRAVIMDPGVLASLPERELRAGWAEVIKHGLILDGQLFRELKSVAGTPASMVDPYLIGWSTAIKAAVVSEDERETDRRSLLNYGHTIGHALEAVTGYDRFLHGEAVAIGMRAAGLLSVEMEMLSQAEFDEQQAVVGAAGLPDSAPGVDVQAVLDATLLDKKVSGGRVKWVLLDRIGMARTRSDVPSSLVRKAVEAVTR